MEAKGEIRKFFSLPMVLIGSGSFVSIIGWLGLAQAAGGIIFLIGSILLSFSGSMAILCGLMSLERPPPSPTKLRKLKIETSRNLKIQYPSFILKVEKLKEKNQALYNKLPNLRSYYIQYREDTRNMKSVLVNLDKQLQENLKNHAPIIDSDSADGIAKKILWSEKQIQLTQMNDSFEKLSGLLTTTDLEKYRVALSYISAGLSQLDQGIEYYRELMILCNMKDSEYDNINSIQQKVDRTNELMAQQETRIQNLETEMVTKFEEAKLELSLFQKQLDDFQIDEQQKLFL